MAAPRTRHPFAKAMTKKSYQMGAPLKLYLPGFIPGILVWMLTGWCWELLLRGVVWCGWVYLKFSKDQLYFNYLLDSLLEDSHLEP